jgi:His/Glu/Gln/Arg/opine family amino acid ABC transporter permease subunit
MLFNSRIITDALPAMLEGLVLTVEIAVWGMVLALTLGLLVAAVGLSRYGTLRAAANVWLTLLRGVPLLVFMYWLYYGLPQATGTNLGSFLAAVLALGLTGSAYMAEVYRSGLQAVEVGQHEAASALGLPGMTTFWRIVFPQASRFIIGPSVNVFVGLLKGATIVSVIGVADMLYVAKQVSTRSFAPFELYSTAGFILIAITVVVALGGLTIERRLDRGRLRHG